jgi:hemolysin III
MTGSIDTQDSDRPGSAQGEADDLPEALADGVAQFLGKPRARGWIHLY